MCMEALTGRRGGVAPPLPLGVVDRSWIYSPKCCCCGCGCGGLLPLPTLPVLLSEAGAVEGRTRLMLAIHKVFTFAVRSLFLSFFLSFFPFFLSSENENEWFKFVVLSVILRFFVSIVFTPLYIKKITWTCGRVPLCLSLLFRVDKASLTFFNFFFLFCFLVYFVTLFGGCILCFNVYVSVD